jgi:hypothetical protein
MHKMTLKPIKLTPHQAKLGLLPDINDPNCYCRVCEKSYDSRGLYRKHIRRSHKMVLMPLKYTSTAIPEALPSTYTSTLKYNDCKEPISLYAHICESNQDKYQYQHQHQSIQERNSLLLLIMKRNFSLIKMTPNFYCRACDQTNLSENFTPIFK